MKVRADRRSTNRLVWLVLAVIFAAGCTTTVGVSSTERDVSIDTEAAPLLIAPGAENVAEAVEPPTPIQASAPTPAADTPTPAASTAVPDAVAEPTVTAEPRVTVVPTAARESLSKPTPTATVEPTPQASPTATVEPTTGPTPQLIPTTTPEPAPTGTVEPTPTPTPGTDLGLFVIASPDGPLALEFTGAAAPTEVVWRTVRTGSGVVPTVQDAIDVAYVMYSWTTGAVVEDTADYGGLITLFRGDGFVPAALEAALGEHRVGARFVIVFPEGMQDLPENFEPGAYAMVVDVVAVNSPDAD